MGDRIICAPPSVFALWRTYLTDEEAELLRRPLTIDNLTFQSIVLGKVLTSAGGSGKDTFAMPDTHIFLIAEIRAHLLPQDLSADTNFTYGSGSAAVTDPEWVRLLRLQNCTVSLKNMQRNELIVGVQGANSGSVALSDLAKPYGDPIKAEALQSLAIVRPKDTLELSVALKKVAAAQENASGAEYGLLATGYFLRRKNG